MSDETLYDRIGGEDAVAAVVDEFYERVLDDDRLAGYFDDAEMADLREHQTKFLSAVTGGPVEYTGESMREAHAHLDLTEEDFARVAEHLEDSLRAFDVPDEGVDEVLGAVADLKTDILAR
ncbi:group 1 truncated hemoglobin [Halostella sp. JP-L12]|uniref:group I truncated hemoglobin n=1 Tax=Halostella TaxID=1843185 RepID=UPI000EF7A75A|nr:MULTISPECIES: group 1 truncated hemoglobin [Halostella]NHN48883.1 group 1 truncated hemoglobin [Halostella sp. JP-L12]